MREGTVLNENDFLKGFLIEGEDEQGKTVKQEGLFCVYYFKDDESKREFGGTYIETQRMLNFKNGDEKAFNYYAERVNRCFDPKWENCVCVAVPSSNSERKCTPVQKLVTHLASLHPGMVDGSGVLVRTKTIKKLSEGGDRDPKVHLDSIIVDKNCGIDISGRDLLLLDDVTTSGGSFIACKKILEKSGAAKVNLLALAQTQHINIDYGDKNKEYQVMNEIRINGGFEKAECYFREGEYGEAVKSLENVLMYGLRGWRPLLESRRAKFLKTNYGEEAKNTTKLIEALEKLAEGYSRVGKNEEAVKKFEDALELILRKELELILTNTTPIINGVRLASSQYKGLRYRYDNSNYGEAESVNLVEDVLVFIKLALESGGTTPTADLIFAMNGLALSYHNLGRNEEAVKLYEGVLSIREALFNEKKNPKYIPGLIYARNRLAVSYLKIDRKKEAEEQFKKVLDLWQEEFQKEENPETSLGLISAKNRLAVCYQIEGKDEEARELYKEVLTFRHKALREEEEPQTTEELISDMNWLALSYRSIGGDKEAVKLFEEVLSIRQKAFEIDPKTSLGLISAMNQLALSYCSVGRIEDARKKYEDVLSIRQKAFKENENRETTEELISAMEKLASCASESGSFETATELRKELLSLYKRHFGECDSLTINAMVDLANAFIDLGKYEEAEELFKKVEVASINEGGFKGSDRDKDTEALFQALSELIEAEGDSNL